MTKKDEIIIEPSEIIVDMPTSSRENISRVNPWIRFLARIFDYGLFFFLLSLVFSFHEKIRAATLTLLLWIPVEAFFLNRWGKTPGKFLLKTQIFFQNRKKIPFSIAFSRSVLVWIKGMGFGLPIIPFITMFFAYSKLKTMQKTSWDKELTLKVIHFPLPMYRLVISLVFIAFVIIYSQTILN